jgi:hypothetical protein
MVVIVACAETLGTLHALSEIDLTRYQKSLFSGDTENGRTVNEFEVTVHWSDALLDSVPIRMR